VTLFGVRILYLWHFEQGLARNGKAKTAQKEKVDFSGVGIYKQGAENSLVFL